MRSRRVAFAVGTLVVVAVIGVVLLAVPGGTGERRPAETPAIVAATLPVPQTAGLAAVARVAGARLVSYRYAFGINQHTYESVRYPTNPPTNGPHAPTWAQDGNYAGQPAPPTEMVVHAQEHGRVVIQYRPGTPRAILEKLVGLYEESPQHVLLVENATGMRCEVAATAWGHGVLCPSFSDRSIDALRAFRDRYRDKGPEAVP